MNNYIAEFVNDDDSASWKIEIEAESLEDAMDKAEKMNGTLWAIEEVEGNEK